MTSFSQIEAAGISICHDFAPGDLGRLIHIHGIQNFADYGYNHVHEAYCAQIAVEFILGHEKGRSRAWLAKRQGKVVGSVFIIERPNNEAQLRLLFVDRSLRGVGLGRWFVEEAIRYCRACEFAVVYLWTMQGLDRAISIYESVGFTRAAEKRVDEWGKSSLEIRFDLNLPGHPARRSQETRKPRSQDAEGKGQR
jgi:GNAT superfamily N-acetyltransferase